MDNSVFHSFMFMGRLERERALEKHQDVLDYVQESYFVLSTEDGTQRIPTTKEQVVKQFEVLAENARERAYLKNLAIRVLDRNADLEAVAESYGGTVRIDSSKLSALVNVLLDVEQHRYEAMRKADDNGELNHLKRLNNTYSYVNIADKLISMITNIQKNDIEYIRYTMNALSKLTPSAKKDGFAHIVNFKLMELFEIVRLKADLFPDALQAFKDSDIAHHSYETVLIEFMGLVPMDSSFYQSMMKQKNELESQIDIILSEYEIKGREGVISLYIESSSKHDIIPSVISHMRGHQFDGDKIRTHIVRKKPFTYGINYTDIFKMKNAYPELQFEQVTLTNGETCILATDFLNLSLLLKDEETSDIITVYLVKNCIMTHVLEVLLEEEAEVPSSVPFKRIKFREGRPVNLDLVKEGIQFTEDGGFKLTYKKGTTYMDDYSRINTIIVQNARNKNVEGMKQDLAYLFTFINELESLIKGKERLTDSVREDAMKARMFAKGDFKQYLAIVQQTDPMFNFTKYYEENYVSKGKVLVEFSNAEVRGFKKLLRTIIG